MVTQISTLGLQHKTAYIYMTEKTVLVLGWKLLMKLITTLSSLSCLKNKTIDN